MKYALAFAFVLATQVSVAQRVDSQCMTDCSARYSGAYCRSACTIQPRVPYDIAAGQQQANPVGAFLQGRAMRQEADARAAETALLEAQRRQVEAQTKKLEQAPAERAVQLDVENEKLRQQLEQARFENERLRQQADERDSALCSMLKPEAMQPDAYRALCKPKATQSPGAQPQQSR